MERPTRCSVPHVALPDGRVIPTLNDREYCMWESDFVSTQALDNFRFEEAHWKWVVRPFGDLYSKTPLSTSDQENCPLGFLDIGVNVGDWISPNNNNNKQQSPTTTVASSMILPFSLAPLAQAQSIHTAGGVCFSKPYETEAVANIGGRSVASNNLDNCPASGATGATTLEHALQALVKTTTTCANSRKSDKGPRIYILKIDVEGHKFKAVASVVPWLAQHTPCYIVIEYWKKPSYTAMIELLMDLGYDAVWRTNENEHPPDNPWWSKDAPGKGLHPAIANYTRRHRYSELVVGFRDVDACVARLQRKQEKGS